MVDYVIVVKVFASVLHLSSTVQFGGELRICVGDPLFALSSEISPVSFGYPEPFFTSVLKLGLS